MDVERAVRWHRMVQAFGALTSTSRHLRACENPMFTQNLIIVGSNAMQPCEKWTTQKMSTKGILCSRASKCVPSSSWPRIPAHTTFSTPTQAQENILTVYRECNPSTIPHSDFTDAPPNVPQNRTIPHREQHPFRSRRRRVHILLLRIRTDPRTLCTSISAI